MGKELGLAASVLAVLGYLMIGLGITLFFGIVAQDLVETMLGGPTLSWWLNALVLVVAVGVFGYFSINVSARVLSLVMVLEIAIVLVFDVAVAADGARMDFSSRRSRGTRSAAGRSAWPACSPVSRSWASRPQRSSAMRRGTPGA